MKILFVNKFFYLKGGSEYLFFDSAKYLENKGHKIIFFSMKHPKNIASEYEKYFISNVDYENNNFVNIIKSSLKLLYSFESKSKIEKIIKEQKPDIVHLNNIYHQMSPSILHSIKKYNLPVVMTLHDLKLACPSYIMSNRGEICEDCQCRGNKYYYCFLNKCVKSSRLKSLLNVLEMYLHHNILNIYDLVDIFIVPSKFLKDKLQQARFKKKIIHLPNFIRLREVFPEYGWKERSIVYFGRLSKEKGLNILIDALKGIKEVKLKIIGEGPFEKDIKNKIKTENITNVVLLGHMGRQALEEEVKRSMFVVLPSIWYENNPRCIIEAFAFGKPAVASRIGGISEIVKDNETGLTFESRNPEDLHIKIKYLMDHPSKIIEMGKNARMFAERKFDADKYHERLIEIYNGVKKL